MTPREAAFVDALVEAGADAAFQHDGLIFYFTPKWVVEAYAAARLGRQPAEAVLKACIVAHVGEASFAECRGLEGWLFWRIGRAWVSRLGDLERRVRGRPASGSITEVREEAHA